MAAPCHHGYGAALVHTDTTEREASGMAQTPEARIGEVISGECVTMRTQYTGIVDEVIGPIASPDCGGYRYRLTETGKFYSNGNPIRPIVYYGQHVHV